MENKCEVIGTVEDHKKKCGKRATFIVRHRDHKECKSFNVCEAHITGYRYKIDPRAECSFIVKEITALTGEKNDK